MIRFIPDLFFGRINGIVITHHTIIPYYKSCERFLIFTVLAGEYDMWVVFEEWDK